MPHSNLRFLGDPGCDSQGRPASTLLFLLLECSIWHFLCVELVLLV